MLGDTHNCSGHAIEFEKEVTKFKFCSFKKEWKGGDPWSLVTIKEEKERKAELMTVNQSHGLDVRM